MSEVYSHFHEESQLRLDEAERVGYGFVLPALNNVSVVPIVPNLHQNSAVDHFFGDDPHVYYMHVHGMGKASDLAKRVKPALDLIGHVKQPIATPASTGGTTLDSAKLAKIVGHDGEKKRRGL